MCSEEFYLKTQLFKISAILSTIVEFNGVLYNRCNALICNDLWFIIEKMKKYEVYEYSKRYCRLYQVSPLERCYIIISGIKLFKELGALHQIALLYLLKCNLNKIDGIDELEDLAFSYDNALIGEEIPVDVLMKYFNDYLGCLKLEGEPTPRRLRLLEDFIKGKF